MSAKRQNWPEALWLVRHMQGPLTAFALSAAVAWLIVGGLVVRQGASLNAATSSIATATDAA